MKTILFIFLVAFTLNGCGHRGDLKRPSEVRAEEMKKQQKKQEEQHMDPLPDGSL